MEISGVELGANCYQTTATEVAQAPSRAKMKTRVGDIAISTTRPHRGAIVEIKDEGIIASTGFSIIRELDCNINEKWFLFTLLSQAVLQQMLQRSSGGNYPAIVEDEIKNIYIPLLDTPTQQKMVDSIEGALNQKSQILSLAEGRLAQFYNSISETFSLITISENRLCYAIKLKNLDGVIDAKRYASVRSTEHALSISDICHIIEEKVNVSRYGKQIIDWILKKSELDLLMRLKEHSLRFKKEIYW